MFDDSTAMYAIDNTKVLYVPGRSIDSFGSTRYSFRLLTEPMDAAGHCRVRSGWVEANPPRIIRPSSLCEVEMDGFSDEAARFFEWMRERGADIRALVKYGFNFSRSEVQCEYLHEDIREVSDKVVKEAQQSGDYFRAVITGVDDAWELSLLCFMIQMIRQSHEINIFDFKRRGLL